ncbi:MAG TPA: NADPH-dependent glutamate synthase [Candidatus Edwardsbacteria bacterium]|nr:NADPH-dependent glutamate synthase [Candidatus Edwardsbacteria bacterium]
MTESTKDDLKQIAPGTDLTVFCPHCHQGLNTYDPATGKAWFKLHVTANGQEGDLLLSSKMEDFTRQSTLDLTDGQAVDGLSCPFCRTSIIERDGHCGQCNSPAARLTVSVQSRLIPFFICTKVGCRWHGITKADEQRIKPKVPRQKVPEQDALLRIRNFNEVPYGFTRELALAEAGRCLECKNPRCRAGCPVEIDIPAFVRLIKEGKFAEAAQKIKEQNALPAICGRVCPQEDQCENVCVVGLKDAPVAIGSLERFAADMERETKAVMVPKKAPPSGRKIAIVGSGPSGLTLAADMVVKGHSVTVFEALHKPGGVLVYGIPEFRLPKAIVDAEVNYLRRMGVKVEVNSLIGRLYDIDDLRSQGYDAVFLGVGAGLPVFMNIPGENLCNIYSANEYLTRINLMKAYAFPDYDTPAPKGRQVVVVGAGNVAMDCARTALRMGSREVTVVYRRSRSEMPARLDEIHHAEEEGIKFRLMTNPVRYIGDDQRWVRQVECVQMKLGEPDASGRPRPIPVAGSNFLIETDLAIVAVGAGPNPVVFAGFPGLERDQRGYVRTFSDSGRTSLRGVWAGGDITTGSSTVISAMGCARRAGNDIHRFLSDAGTAWP